jgi:hypothetical protein
LLETIKHSQFQDCHHHCPSLHNSLQLQIHKPITITTNTTSSLKMHIPTFLSLLFLATPILSVDDLGRRGQLDPCVDSCNITGNGGASPAIVRQCNACIALPRRVQNAESEQCARECKNKQKGWFEKTYCENCYKYGAIMYDWPGRGKAFRWDKK